MGSEMRMNAYYYSFDETGVPSIDRILSAVACAGKAFHHTDSWSEEAYDGEAPEPHSGKTPVEWIQNAANDAAAELRAENARLQAELAKSEALVRYWHGQYGEMCELRNKDGADANHHSLRADAAEAENARLREAMVTAINCKAMPRLDGRDWYIVLRDALKGGG